ncbi:TPA: restriction endonuclease subunit S [Photobacterium damselae]
MNHLEQVVPEGYKQTEAGVIPDDWDVVSLGDIGNTVIGLTYSPKDVADYGSLVLRSSNIQKNRLAYENNVFVDMDLPERVIVKEGDILVCVRNGSRNLIGKCALIDKNAEGSAFGAFMSIYRTKQSKFIFFQFQSNIIQNQINEIMGATINQITNKDMAGFKVLVPRDEKEQIAIANALSDVDALLAELEKLIAKKQAIKTATMQQLLTGKTRLPQFAIYTEGEKQGQLKGTKPSELGEIPEDWEVQLLKDISSMRGRIGWQGLKQEEFTFNDQQPFLITGMNFKDGKIRWNEVYHIPEDRYEMDRNIQLKVGDILMTKDGTIGKLLFVDHIPKPYKATLNSHLLLFRPKLESYVPKYLYYLMKTRLLDDHIELHKSGSTFFGITQEAMGKLLALLPSNEEQTAIATILSDMDSEIQTLEQRLAKTRQIKQGMMQELLTGKTRLPFKKES